MNREPKPIWKVEDEMNQTKGMAQAAMSQNLTSTEKCDLLSYKIDLLVGRATALEGKQMTFGGGKVTLNLLILNATQEVTITFNQTMPNVSYNYQILPTNPVGLTLGNLTFTEKAGTKTVSGLTVVVKNTGVTISLGSSLNLTVMAQPPKVE